MITGMAKTSAFILLVAALLLAVTSCTAENPAPLPDRFDFTHVELAIDFFESPEEGSPESIAATLAAQHLKNHSDRTGYYPAEFTTLDITNELLKVAPSPQLMANVKGLIDYAQSNPDRQKDCIAEAAAYLPADAQPKYPLYITWGYDIGVAMDERASLNFKHPHFLENPEEIWFYCIHEVHHTGVMQSKPMPAISSIATVEELYDFARYATWLEGLAVYAARDARRSAGADRLDRDYQVLDEPEKRERTVTAYWEKLALLENDFEAPLTDAHWQLIEDMSSGDRLWYVTGAVMAAEIDERLGRDRLLEITQRGPDAFYEAYHALLD